MNKPSIRQHELRPPVGGWSLSYTEKGQRFAVTGNSGSAIVRQIAEIQRLNGTFKGESAIWDYCNGVWGSRDPKRVILQKQPPVPQLPKAMQRDHWKITPAQYGRSLWHWLHTFGTVFNKESWIDAIERVRVILDPAQSPFTGCQECRDEFAKLLKFHDYKAVNSERDAAEWTWIIHNKVNQRLGKKIVSFSEAARYYGWKVEI